MALSHAWGLVAPFEALTLYPVAVGNVSELLASSTAKYEVISLGPRGRVVCRTDTFTIFPESPGAIGERLKAKRIFYLSGGCTMSKKESDAHHVWEFMHDTGMIRDSEDKTTRHEYKQIAEEKGLTTSAGRSTITPLTNQKTIDKYKGILKEFRGFSRREGFGDNLRTLPKEAVSAFLNHKLEDGVGRQRLQDICSCINKAGAFGHNSEFAPAVSAFRQEGMPEKVSTGSRAFENPQAVISTIKGDEAKLAAEIQFRTGLRSENALSFKINASGDTVSFVSKGGMRHEAFPMSQDLIDRARMYSDNQGNVSIMPYRTYEYQIKEAAAANGERLDNGKVKNSHSFRHSFGRDMYNGLIKSGVSKAEAKAEVSEALFHHRADITDLYIK